MALPITDRGTTTKRLPATGFCNYWSQRHQYKQAKPFTLVLPYSAYYFKQKLVSASGTYGTSLGIYGADVPPFSVDWTGIRNKSYEKLRNKLYDQASLGVDFVEYRQSVSMIASTASSLFKAVRSVKRFDFAGAAHHLGMKILPKGVSIRKSFANNWLEFHFGWAPLVKDIYDSCEVLNNPVKSFDIAKGSAKEEYYWHSGQDFGSAYRENTCVGYIYCKQGARVTAIPGGGLHTLDQFGVINPLVLAWEVIPFSFVVDWFVNVGQFLSSLTDFAGMTLGDTFRTEGYKIAGNYFQYTKSGFLPSGTLRDSGYYVYSQRYTTLSGVALNVKRLKPPSIERAATAISLLTQAFPFSKKNSFMMAATAR